MLFSDFFSLILPYKPVTVIEDAIFCTRPYKLKDMLTKNIEDQELIDKIIQSCDTCYLGVIDDDGNPYVVPMNFGYDGEQIILHSGPEGGLLDFVEKRPNVCVTFNSAHQLIAQHESVACSYRMKGESVICRGKVRFEEDLDKKKELLDVMMNQYVKGKSFDYSVPALRNVKVWIVDVYDCSSRAFGVRHPYSKKYNAEDELYSK